MLKIGSLLAYPQPLSRGWPNRASHKAGEQYNFTSPQYTKLVEAAGSKISMDGKGRALDNIFTERLWRTVKWENVYLADYKSVEESRAGLSQYFEFYVQRRPHQALSYQTPAQLYFGQGGSNSTN